MEKYIIWVASTGNSVPREKLTTEMPLKGNEYLFSNNTGNMVINEFFKKPFSPNSFTQEPNADVYIFLHANILHPYLYKLCKKQWASDPDWVRKLDKKIIVLGVGCQPDDPDITADEYIKLLEPDTIDLMRAYAEKCEIIGTRGEFTSEVLKKMGIDSEPIGCPSWYCNLDKQPVIQQKEWSLGNKGVFASWGINTGGEENFTPRLSKIAFQFNDINYLIQTEAKFMDYVWYFNRNGYYYSDKSSEAMLTSANLIAKNFGVPLEELLTSDKWKNLFKFFVDTDKWGEYIRSRDFFFGARIHSSIMALKNGIPAFPVAYDGRVKELCETYKLPYISKKQLMADNFDFRDVWENTDFSEMNKAYHKLLQNYLSFLRKNGIELNDDNPFRDGFLNVKKSKILLTNPTKRRSAWGRVKDALNPHVSQDSPLRKLYRALRSSCKEIRKK